MTNNLPEMCIDCTQKSYDELLNKWYCPAVEYNNCDGGLPATPEGEEL
jgi:hypothetical protein